MANYPVDDCSKRKLVNDLAYEVEMSEILPRPDSIFFVESSGSSTLTARVACAIESAAFHHPHSHIYVILTSPKVNVKSVDHLTKSYTNINFRYLHVRSFLRGTALERLWTESKIQNSKYVVSHLSDILRYSLLWRFGGTYVDTDVIFIRGLPDTDQVPNLIGKERQGKPHVAAGVMRFQFGHPLMSRMQEYLASNFDGNVWGANGPLAITQILYDTCKVDNADEMTPERCLGVTVFNHTAFYAVPYYEWSDIFDDTKTADVMAALSASYALHMWGRFSSAVKIAPKVASGGAQRKNAFKTVASKSCPVTYQLFDLL